MLDDASQVSLGNAIWVQAASGVSEIRFVANTNEGADTADGMYGPIEAT